MNSYLHAIHALETSLAGELIRPADEAYEAARHAWDGSFDRYPAVIVRAAGAQDVVHAVNFAREHSLPVSVKSGGHSLAGHSTNDGGLLLDLSGMNAIDIDPERRTARIEPGLTWGGVANAANEHGLALTSGDMMSVGVGGLTLGGGIGWMVRKHGLTIDHLISVELVTADGRLVKASAGENSDLFWALRGGGGNFGVVTAFEFRLDPGGLILGGAIFYDADNAEEILRAYGRYTSQAPDELTAMSVIMHAPPAPFIPADKVGAPVVAILVCYTGDLEEGQRVVQPLRELGTPIVDITGPMPYPAMFALTAEGAVPGHRHGGYSMFLDSLDGEALHTMVEESLKMTAPHAMAQIRTLGGAMGRVPEDATAFAHRDKPFMFTIISSWLDPAEDELRHAEALSFWQAMRPYASGVYVNFLTNEGEERIKSAYKRATYDRLVALKNRYDPANLFRYNQNIKPTVDASDEVTEDYRARRAA